MTHLRGNIFQTPSGTQAENLVTFSGHHTITDTVAPRPLTFLRGVKKEAPENYKDTDQRACSNKQGTSRGQSCEHLFTVPTGAMYPRGQHMLSCSKLAILPGSERSTILDY
jgi:hypothetical protein